LSEEMINYFCSFLAVPSKEKDPTHDDDNAKKIMADLIDSVFSSLLDIVPYSSSPRFTNTEFYQAPDKNPNQISVNSPLILICSRALHMVPWELMLGDPVVRYWCLKDVTESRIAKRSLAKLDVLPRYFGCYFSGGDRQLVPFEEKRREWLTKELHYGLNFRTRLPSSIRHSNICAPFHSPLIKYGKKITAAKKKYKFITWFDLALLVGKPSDVLQLVDRTELSTHLSVFIFSFADLLELSEPLICLMRHRLSCTFLFIPGHKIKLVVQKLMKLQEQFIKSKSMFSNHYSYLMNSVSVIQTEFHVPIAVFNPPSSRV